MNKIKFKETAIKLKEDIFIYISGLSIKFKIIYEKINNIN